MYHFVTWQWYDRRIVPPTDEVVVSFYVRGIKRFEKITAKASMKFSKPHYDAKEQVYTVSITEGIRFEQDYDQGEWKQSIEDLFRKSQASLIELTIQLTKGWFSKPLTPEYLTHRLQVQCPTITWDDFEGKVVWEISQLFISKQSFTFVLALVSKTPVERVMIELQEEDHGSQRGDEEGIEFEQEGNEDALTIGPTRRRMVKLHVMRARARAARALYKAEQLTQAYCDAYGEDTDWDEDASSEDESEEEDM